MERILFSKIEEVMKNSGMTVFTKPFDITLGAIRTKDSASNEFNDWIFAFCFNEAGKRIGIMFEGTTDAGLYWRLNPMRTEGTAIIKHGVQHRGAYQLQDPNEDKSKRGHKGQKAFRQIKSMSYWRDADRDKYLEFDGEHQEGIFFTNGHYMGTVGNKVDKWSAGCWGSTVENMDDLFKICELQINAGLGDNFSFALLHEDAFE